MSDWAAKRFWTDTTVEADGQGYTVRLDGRAVKTPAKTPLIVPTKTMASSIAAEWQAQEDKIDPNTMPFTRSANSAIDRVAVQFNEVADLIADYAGTELMCYRADTPQALVDRQARVWDPILDWAEQTYDARLTLGSGVMHVPQSKAEVEKLRAEAFKFTVFELTAFYDLVSLSGSYVLALAVIRDFISSDKAWDASRVDETWQVEQWGTDEEAESMALVKRAAFKHAHKFFVQSQSE